MGYEGLRGIFNKKTWHLMAYYLYFSKVLLIAQYLLMVTVQT